ncbi:leucine rich repeat containing 75Bb isoform 2-T2 [Aplochiton taeniatus]
MDIESKFSKKRRQRNECPGEGRGGGDFLFTSLMLKSDKLPGMLRKSNHSPYVRRVAWIREMQKLLQEQRVEQAAEVLKLLRKDLGLQGTSLNDILYKNAAFLNLVDPISHELLLNLARDMQCPKRSEDNPEEEADQQRGQPVRHPHVRPRPPPRGILPPVQWRLGVLCGPQLHRAPGRQPAPAAALAGVAAQTDHPGAQRKPADGGHLEGPHGGGEGPAPVPQPGLGGPGQQRGHLHRATAPPGGPAAPLRPAEQPAHHLRVQRGAGRRQRQLQPGDLRGGAQPLRGGRRQLPRGRGGGGGGGG